MNSHVEETGHEGLTGKCQDQLFQLTPISNENENNALETKDSPAPPPKKKKNLLTTAVSGRNITILGRDGTFQSIVCQISSAGLGMRYASYI